jgi:hypothetical protein
MSKVQKTTLSFAGHKYCHVRLSTNTSYEPHGDIQVVIVQEFAGYR